MRVRHKWGRRRKGGNLVEAGVVLPLSFLFIIGMCVMGLGVFRYQQVAALAREGARWASVHGTSYAEYTQSAPATPADVYNNAILPMAVGMDIRALSYEVEWPTGNAPPATVVVKVIYQWTPELYITGPVNLSSTSVMPMTF
jgi:hypothetical protein